ncbi:MAG: hypothetical protein E7559_05420 [Ruminococcaceae bacterium]|nr:hypothetical protein [Oscillospiraceae bacterium]
MSIRCVWEHNGEDTLLYCVDFVGAYSRGESLSAAVDKLPTEVDAYAAWAGVAAPEDMTIEIVQEKCSDLRICDADSDVLFEEEKKPLTRAEYDALMALAMKSAEDFHTMYLSIPDKDASCLPRRETFYGQVPRTAREMYDHTAQVNAYYFGEVSTAADNQGTIVERRARGFEILENVPDFLSNAVFDGSYGELWTVRKMLRRFLWHDRIHARAMYRMAVKTFGEAGVTNCFNF